MNQTNYLKIFSALAFVAFAGVSCWATVESLHLLQPSIPVLFLWIATVGFFVLASWGSKKIVDSLNQNIYLENRRWHLLGGVVILIIFWLICSMPTNTHTFFYRSVVKDVVTKDMSRTKSYLMDLLDNKKIKEQMDLEWSNFEKDIQITFRKFLTEIDNPSRPGIGERCETILLEIESKLNAFDANTGKPNKQSDKIQRIKPKANTQKAWVDVAAIYARNIDDILAIKKKSYFSNVAGITKVETKNEIKANVNNLNKMLTAIHDMDGLENDVMINSGKVLTESYSTISNNSKYIIFKDSADMVLYKGGTVSDTDRMLSVIDVWKDFVKGKYAGRGFVFWIIIAILVDVAAFIFFDIAFKKEY